jgi:hypothetical protein
MDDEGGIASYVDCKYGVKLSCDADFATIVGGNGEDKEKGSSGDAMIVGDCERLACSKAVAKACTFEKR